MTDKTNMTDTIEALLPWYATGKLSLAERSRIDKALLTDPELARRLSLVQEEIGAFAMSNERIAGPSTRAFDKVMASVAAEPRQMPVIQRAKQGLLDWLGDTLQAFAPRSLALAACAAVAVVALQTAMLGGYFGSHFGETSSSSRYGTASAPATVTLSGTFIMIGFAPRATAGDIAAFLKRFDASIVDGPRASGLFRLRIGEKTLDTAQLDAVLDGMKKETGIVAMVATER